MKRLTTYNRLRTLGLSRVMAWRLSAALTLTERLLIPTGIALSLALWTALYAALVGL